jgi:hypothetical protein
MPAALKIGDWCNNGCATIVVVNNQYAPAIARKRDFYFGRRGKVLRVALFLWLLG